MDNTDARVKYVHIVSDVSKIQHNAESFVRGNYGICDICNCLTNDFVLPSQRGMFPFMWGDVFVVECGTKNIEELAVIYGVMKS